MTLATIGEARLSRVEELRIPNRIGSFTEDQALIDRNRDWLTPHFLDAEDRFDLVFQSWIVEVDGRVVLIDPCTGNGRPHPVSFFSDLDVPFIERMDDAGYRPEDIDLVICTHLHHDHCGWNTRLRDGRWVPTFPNARYIFQRAEYDRWGLNRAFHIDPDYNVGVFERSVRPIVEAGLADLIDGEHRLSAGLRIEAAPGHTAGHQILHLCSAGHRAIFTGDSFHHPIQLVEPSIMFGDTELPGEVTALRCRLAATSADEDAWLIPAHLPAPHAVRAHHANGALRFTAPDWKSSKLLLNLA